jgi:hypothetical protein
MKAKSKQDKLWIDVRYRRMVVPDFVPAVVVDVDDIECLA